MINRYNHISAQLLMKCVLDHLKYTDEDIMIPKTTHAGRGQGHLDESKKTWALQADIWCKPWEEYYNLIITEAIQTEDKKDLWPKW